MKGAIFFLQEKMATSIQVFKSVNHSLAAEFIWCQAEAQGQITLKKNHKCHKNVVICMGSAAQELC